MGDEKEEAVEAPKEDRKDDVEAPKEEPEIPKNEEQPTVA
jgi:hypothetical protein